MSLKGKLTLALVAVASLVSAQSQRNSAANPKGVPAIGEKGLCRSRDSGRRVLEDNCWAMLESLVVQFAPPALSH